MLWTGWRGVAEEMWSKVLSQDGAWAKGEKMMISLRLGVKAESMAVEETQPTLSSILPGLTLFFDI